MNWKLTEWNDGVKLVSKPTSVILKLASGDAHLNSIYTEAKVKIGQYIDILYVVSTLQGKPKFVAMDGGAPANFSPMICKSTALDGRWYIAGEPRVTCALLQDALDKGKRDFHWPILSGAWQDVNGKQSDAGFKKGVSEAQILEVVFGGKFRGHGIQVTGGRVRIELAVTIK
jgi:hypothetical protein